MRTSLGTALCLPDDAESGDRRVVNLVASAHEEHDAFLVGRLERLPDAHGGSRDGGDLREGDGRALIIRVSQQRVKRCLGGFGEVRIAPLDPADPARDEDVLVVDGSIEQQVGDVGALPWGNQEAADHGLLVSQWWVCEGSHTARLLAARLADPAPDSEAA